MTKIILLRHGESESNVNRKTIMHPPDTPLTSKGRKQAQKAAKFIKNNYNIKLIISSPHTRAQQTAKECKKYIKTKYDENSLFEEINGGDLQKINKEQLSNHHNGKKIQTLINKMEKLDQTTGNQMLHGIKNFSKQLKLENAYFDLVNGENITQLRQRVQKSVKYLNSLKINGDILIITHFGPCFFSRHTTRFENVHLVNIFCCNGIICC